MRNLSTTFLIIASMLVSCNNMNRNGENQTPEGTTTTNAINSDMESNRVPAETDTIASPGSNSMDLKKNGNVSNKGTGKSTGNDSAAGSVDNAASTDKNTMNQSSTHGRSTTAGDNGAK